MNKGFVILQIILLIYLQPLRSFPLDKQVEIVSYKNEATDKFYSFSCVYDFKPSFIA